jgi:hypothetical protein
VKSQDDDHFVLGDVVCAFVGVKCEAEARSVSVFDSGR